MHDLIIKDEPLDLDDRHDPPESYLVNSCDSHPELETVHAESIIQDKASEETCHMNETPTEVNSAVEIPAVENPVKINLNAEGPDRVEPTEPIESPQPIAVDTRATDEPNSSENSLSENDLNDETAPETDLAEEYLENDDALLEEYLVENDEIDIGNETDVTISVKRSTRKRKKVVKKDFVSEAEGKFQHSTPHPQTYAKFHLNSDILEKKSRRKRKDNKKSSKSSPYSDYIEFSDDRAQFTCKFCRRIWTNRSNIRTFNQFSSTYSILFLFPGNINSHILLHLNEQRFTCQYCGKRFNTKSEVVRHIRCHTGERPFACDICPKAFRTSDKLKDHINMHNNIRSFKCPDCDKSFIQRGHLTSHRRVHVRIYQCAADNLHFPR